VADLARETKEAVLTGEEDGDGCMNPEDSSQLLEHRHPLMDHEEPQQPQGPSKIKALLILVAILCGACLLVSGLLVMGILGAYCVGSNDEFCPGVVGAAIMLIIGFAPFFMLMVVMIYNALYFNVGPGDSGTWVEMQL